MMMMIIMMMMMMIIMWNLKAKVIPAITGAAGSIS